MQTQSTGPPVRSGYEAVPPKNPSTDHSQTKASTATGSAEWTRSRLNVALGDSAERAVWFGRDGFEHVSDTVALAKV